MKLEVYGETHAYLRIIDEVAMYIERGTENIFSFRLVVGTPGSSRSVGSGYGRYRKDLIKKTNMLTKILEEKLKQEEKTIIEFIFT